MLMLDASGKVRDEQQVLFGGEIMHEMMVLEDQAHPAASKRGGFSVGAQMYRLAVDDYLSARGSEQPGDYGQ